MYKTLHTMANTYLWTCHSDPSASDLFVTKHRHHFQRTCFYRSQGCLPYSGTDKTQHFYARDTRFPISIHSIYGKPLVVILSPSFFHLSVFRQKTRRTGMPRAGTDGRSQTAQTKAYLTGSNSNQTSSNSFPSYKVDTLRQFGLDLSCTFKLLISEMLNVYRVIKD